MKKGRRKHFYMRVYAAVLALFLACLYGGAAAFVAVSYKTALQSQTEAAKAEQQAVATEIAGFAAEYGKEYRWALSILLQEYAKALPERGIFLQFITPEGEVLFDSMPEGVAEQVFAAEIAPTGMYSVLPLQQNKASILLFSQHIDVGMGEDGGYILFFAKDITAFRQGWQRTVWVYAAICVAVSLVLAAGLYLLLRRLAQPLAQLTSITRSFAQGKHDVRAPLGEQNDEIGELSATFNDMADSINEKMDGLQAAAEQKQQLVDTLSHEIRTPTAAIHGYAEYLQQAALSEEQKLAMAQRILDESKRLGRIADTMLQLSSLQKESLCLQSLSMDKLLQDAAATLQPRAKQAGVSLLVKPAGAWRIQGDAVLLQSLVLNLTENAIKACREGGRVELAPDEAANTLAVRDNGHGMAPEELAHLGEPFWRADTARQRRLGGAGLGVALCNRICLLHGAALSYTSTPGKGTTATVAFAAEKEQ